MFPLIVFVRWSVVCQHTKCPHVGHLPCPPPPANPNQASLSPDSQRGLGRVSAASAPSRGPASRLSLSLFSLRDSSGARLRRRWDGGCAGPDAPAGPSSQWVSTSAHLGCVPRYLGERDSRQSTKATRSSSSPSGTRLDRRCVVVTGPRLFAREHACLSCLSLHGGLFTIARLCGDDPSGTFCAYSHAVCLSLPLPTSCWHRMPFIFVCFLFFPLFSLMAASLCQLASRTGHIPWTPMQSPHIREYSVIRQHPQPCYFYHSRDGQRARSGKPCPLSTECCAGK